MHPVLPVRAAFTSAEVKAAGFGGATVGAIGGAFLGGLPGIGMQAHNLKHAPAPSTDEISLLVNLLTGKRRQFYQRGNRNMNVMLGGSGLGALLGGAVGHKLQQAKEERPTEDEVE